jgi:hypothetical protein
MRNYPPRQISIFVRSVWKQSIKTPNRQEGHAPIGNIAGQETTAVVIFYRMFVQRIVGWRRCFSGHTRFARVSLEISETRSQPTTINNHVVVGKKHDVSRRNADSSISRARWTHTFATDEAGTCQLTAHVGRSRTVIHHNYFDLDVIRYFLQP